VLAYAFKAHRPYARKCPNIFAGFVPSKTFSQGRCRYRSQSWNLPGPKDFRGEPRKEPRSSDLARVHCREVAQPAPYSLPLPENLLIDAHRLLRWGFPRTLPLSSGASLLGVSLQERVSPRQFLQRNQRHDCRSLEMLRRSTALIGARGHGGPELSSRASQRLLILALPAQTLCEIPQADWAMPGMATFSPSLAASLSKLTWTSSALEIRWRQQRARTRYLPHQHLCLRCLPCPRPVLARSLPNRQAREQSSLLSGKWHTHPFPSDRTSPTIRGK